MQYKVDEVLAHFGHEGEANPGGFALAMLECLERADNVNRVRLCVAFPEWGVPFILAKEHPGGIAALKDVQGVMRRVDGDVEFSTQALMSIAERLAPAGA